MRRHLLLGLVLLLSAGLRFYALDASSLWSDEGNTWALLERSFAQIAADAAADIHPPGYYWLLKIWTQLFDASAYGMRSFSAASGCLLVWIIYRIGLRLPAAASPYDNALLAALVAALHPLQIYYSQERRMYMLLALEGALLFWALLRLLDYSAEGRRPSRNRSWWLAAAGFVLAGSAGLWTHYSFPIVLAAAGGAYFVQWIMQPASSRAFSSLGGFLMLNGLILISYLPWLATALNRVFNWPQGGEAIAPAQALQLTLHTLTVGPLRHLSDSSGPLIMALLPLLGVFALWRSSRMHKGRYNSLLIGLLLWIWAPILLMFGLGLFSEAFLKFLLIASPAWCLLSAAAAAPMQPPTASRLPAALLSTGVAAAAIALAIYALPGYYADPLARDNYAGVARYVAAVGDPQNDLVVLDAPGQQEVWRYYNSSLPTLALPQQRPADPAQTVELLAEATRDRHSIFALFWAIDEADPERVVESWLDQNAYKGISSWQGNLRFVTYTRADELTCKRFDSTQTTPIWENQIRLTGWCQGADTRSIRAGEVALVQLQWQSPVLQTQSYKVSLQLLNVNNQVVAQRDSEPAGALRPTSSWAAGETVLDNHGLAIPIGTPPGIYRLIVVLYDGQSNVRTAIGDSDYLLLGEIAVERTKEAIPLEVIAIQHRFQTQLGPLQFVGYDLYRQGFAHAPEQPLAAGDPVHVTLYWQAPTPLPLDWPANLEFVLQLGEQQLQASLAGSHYPTSQWQGGEFVRGEFDLLFDGRTRRPTLTVSQNSLRLAPVP